MKKIFTALFVTLSIYSSFSQYLYTPGLSAEGSMTATYDGDELNVYIYFHNNSPNPVTLAWRLLEDSIPAEWNLGFCDNLNCYYNINNSLYNAKTSDTIPAGDSIFIKGVFDARCVTGEGWIRMSCRVLDGSFNHPDTLFYRAAIDAQCTNSIRETDRWQGVGVYPNPVNNTFTLTGLNPSDEIQIGITDIHGRIVLPNSPVREMQFQTDISGISAGVYLVQLTDKSGQIVAVRRIIKT